MAGKRDWGKSRRQREACGEPRMGQAAHETYRKIQAMKGVILVLRSEANFAE